jgi:hypothetical protein
MCEIIKCDYYEIKAVVSAIPNYQFCSLITNTTKYTNIYMHKQMNCYNISDKTNNVIYINLSKRRQQTVQVINP